MRSEGEQARGMGEVKGWFERIHFAHIGPPLIGAVLRRGRALCAPEMENDGICGGFLGENFLEFWWRGVRESGASGAMLRW